ncbi:hypothetical protein PHYBOEH_001224 [Phytophthora boehmeriae]|uniref:EF-hand domain-containing protein n=1 Tax=Phytophthora boehmeriae TaxID=109152 RepID=A0A8T1WUD1_9STRA|nr:hypothetical protein PHYBOEH_001224 [Phytophthora boehmeriae]
MAASKPTAARDKKKSKKSSRMGGDAGSKDKERKGKDKKSKDKDRKSSKKDKSPAPAQLEAGSVADTVAPIVHDPDAIQLFRRYDRSRSGLLTRLDFLQLFRDYADPAGAWGGGISSARPPLSLTDSKGVPLGYERAERNSEFEAGQLFERYDKEHTGALTLDSFHVFFADFKPQLRAFIEESNYRAVAPPAVSVASAPLQPIQEEPAPVVVTYRDAAAGGDDVAISPKVLRTQYRAMLWKLRKICKEELFDQRDRIVQRMKTIRDEMASRQRHSRRVESKRRSRAAAQFAHFDDGLTSDNKGEINNEELTAKRYEEMEDDLDRLDELVRFVQYYLHKGTNISRREMQEFIDQADKTEDEAQSLAIKDYGEAERPADYHNSKEFSAPAPPPAPSVASVRPPSRRTDLEGLLRVKDQMIYQLLQERATMRKERAAIEASLKKLSDVSTREMKKWARLTDDMQAEIEQLRSQLRPQVQRSTLS